MAMHVQANAPCTGVTVSDVAVPDVALAVPLWAAFVSAAMRSLFAFESLAVTEPTSVR